MGIKTILLTVAIGAMALLTSACTIDVERNPDGSLQVETVVTEQSLAAELERDPQNANVAVGFRNGFLTIDGDRTTIAGGTVKIHLRADVTVEGNAPVVTITEADWDDAPIPEFIVDEWNAGLTEALERLGRQHPDVTLVEVSVDGGEIAMEWRIETSESRTGD